MKIAPCKDCPNRTVGCHAMCAKYRAFKVLQNRQNKRRREAVMNDLLVGNIDDVLAVLKALGEMNTFKTQSLYEVL